MSVGFDVRDRSHPQQCDRSRCVGWRDNPSGVNCAVLIASCFWMVLIRGCLLCISRPVVDIRKFLTAPRLFVLGKGFSSYLLFQKSARGLYRVQQAVQMSLSSTVSDKLCQSFYACDFALYFRLTWRILLLHFETTAFPPLYQSSQLLCSWLVKWSKERYSGISQANSETRLQQSTRGNYSGQRVILCRPSSPRAIILNIGQNPRTVYLWKVFPTLS